MRNSGFHQFWKEKQTMICAIYWDIHYSIIYLDYSAFFDKQPGKNITTF